MAVATRPAHQKNYCAIMLGAMPVGATVVAAEDSGRCYASGPTCSRKRKAFRERRYLLENRH